MNSEFAEGFTIKPTQMQDGIQSLTLSFTIGENLTNGIENNLLPGMPSKQISPTFSRSVSHCATIDYANE
jgi:hypothetical protein